MTGSVSVAASPATSREIARCPCQASKRHTVRDRIDQAEADDSSVPNSQKTGTTTQNSCPDVRNAHEVSANRCERVEQEPALIVHKVEVDGYSEPLRALVDTSASSNFVRTQVVRRQGLDLPNSNKEMIVHLANGSKVTMPKRVVRLAIKCEDFRGEDEFVLLDLDDKFDTILGMPWLKRYQPSIDWMNVKISVDKSRDVDLCCTTKDEVVWVHTSVEEIPDGPCDIAVCDGPHVHKWYPF
ncbi:Gag protein, partial [Globisporangium splendens]